MRSDALVGYLTTSPMFPANRYDGAPVDAWIGIEFCEAHLADRGATFVFDLTYEAVKLLRDASSNVQPCPKCNCRSGMDTKLPTKFASVRLLTHCGSH
jgi:hypothetical protein